MHELSYCEAVLDLVVSRASGRRVTGVGVQIGATHRVVADAFAQTFALAAVGTTAEGARTELVVGHIDVSCLGCGAVTPASDVPVACPVCGDLGIRLSGGDEVVLRWIAYADESTADEAPPQRVTPHSHEHAHEEAR
jgi:hydrogenase nickel incorporation protein HypA/HybF